VDADRRLAAIVFTDIVGYTSLSQEDEPAALRMLREQERLVHGLLEIHRGRQVKSIGDGLLLEFPDALDAVECAIDLQRHLFERNAREGAPALRVRVGVHLGDVQGVGADILGDAVNIASRVEPLADPGGVCLSVQVYDQIRNKLPYGLVTLGPKSLKGVRDPVEVFRVELPWTIEARPPTDSVLPRLAVLPFANISPDPKDEYFADGLTEELISVISQIRGLRVTSRTSVSQFKSSPRSVSQIGKELGVSSVLEGSVRKSGDRLRITVQLIDVQTDDHRWAQTYDRKLDDVFAMQAEIAESTAGALKVELLHSEQRVIQERPTSSLVAYEAYLRGVQAQQQLMWHFTAEGDREVERLFEEALHEDPRFAEAYARLASHLIFVGGESRQWKAITSRIRELAARAIELDRNSSYAHVARGALALQVDHQWDRSEAEFQQAIALNPSSSEARGYYGYLLMILQRFDEARKQYLLAFEQDPLNLQIRSQLAFCEAERGNATAAIALAEKLVAEFPDHLGMHNSLALYYALAGRREDAVRILGPGASSSTTFSRLTRCNLLALLGQPEEARGFLGEWEAGRLAEEVHPRYAAVLYAAVGDDERALTILEQDQRSGDRTLWHVYREPAFDAIRDDPRFVAMLRELNLPTTLTRPRWTRGSRLPS